MSEYNGWTNYATWRVNLEYFDGMSPEDVGGHADADTLRFMVLDLIDSDREAHSLVRDWAAAFVAQVNFHEIADTINTQIEENV